jgi:hypothetical protein
VIIRQGLRLSMAASPGTSPLTPAARRLDNGVA